MEERLKEWQAPPQAAKEDKKLGWLNESTEEGGIWLKNQRGYGDFRRGMEILAGKGDTLHQVDYRSKLRTNRLKRNIREVVGALSNIRPIWGYSSENAAFAPYANMFNKVSRAIYLENYFDRSLKEALQYAAATCTGWLRPVYRRGMGGRGSGSIQMLTYGAPCVLPNQMPSSNDWQEAYVVHLMDEMPIYMAHAMFPDYQDRLEPTKSQYWYSSEIHGAAKGNMWKRLFSGVFKRREEESQSDLYIPVRYSTIIDLSINKTGKTIPMGDPDAPWHYEVPSLGEPLPDGRTADLNDARLYPYRRMMISSEDVVMYDGPCFNWHGMLDLIPICVDDWAWEAIGFSLVHDGYDIQCAIDELDRGMMDKARAQLDLPLGYDINAVSKKEADMFDPMQPRARIGFDGSQVDKPFAPVVPPDVYKIGPEVLAVREGLMKAMDYQLAVNDIVALAEARALGKGTDQMEALKVASGPIVRDISRSMERSLSLVGQQLKYLIPEYLTTFRLMQYVGEDAVTREIFDYDPASITPSHLPDEKATEEGTEKAIPSRYSTLQRARWFAENLRFFIMPHSIHEIVQVTHQLMLLQLKQRGAPIDWRTIMEACNVPNVGATPEGATVQERYWAEQEEMLIHALRVKQIAESLGIDPSMFSQKGGHGAGGHKSQGEGGGRPPSAQAAPQQYQKGDGRSGIKES